MLKSRSTLRPLRCVAAPIASATLVAFVGGLLSPIVALAQQEPVTFELPHAPEGSPPPAVYDEASLDALDQHFEDTDAQPASRPPDLPPTDDELARTLASLPKGAGSVSPQATALPGGAATQLGMGESFTTQLSTGGVAYAIPLALPSARGGVQPRLDLTYNSAGGYGIAGVGWSVGASAIQRQTDRGVPSYADSSDWNPNQDRFIFGGSELVPICTVSGSACSGALEDEVMPSWADGWQYFRSRIEGGFLRFFWKPDHQTWRIQSRDGTNMELGVPLDGTGYEGALERNPDRPGEIFRWYVARQYDSQGTVNSTSPAPNNTVYYRYLEDAGTLYLSDVYDTSPKANPTTTNLASFAHHTRLRYEPRPDIAISYRAGWLSEYALRLVGVDVTSKTTGGGPAAPRELVRRYHVEYDGSSHRSLLVSAQMEGRCSSPVQESGSETLPDTSCPRLPAVRFEYQRIQGTDPLYDSQGYAFEPFDERVYRHANSPAHSLDEALSELMDINADGLPDLVVTAPGLYGDGHGLFCNGLAPDGDYGFGSVHDMGLVPAGDVLDPGGLMLNNPNVVPLDLDADGIINLVHMPRQQSYSVFRPAKAGSGGGCNFQWEGREANTYDRQDVKIDFTQSSADTQVMDVNGDGLVDIVYSSPTEIQTYLSLGRLPEGADRFGQGDWASASSSNISTEPVRACAPWSAQPVRFSDEDTQVADMNGDGLADIVRVRSGQVFYWPGRGNGFWGTGDRDDCLGGPGFATDRHIAMLDAPVFGTTQPGTLLLNDVNGDGLTDMVEVRNQGVDIYLNDSGVAWTDRHIIADTPFRPSASNYVRLTDIDGSGTPDILWGRAYEYDYIDLTGGAVPHLLTRVHNGLGKTLELEYESSTAHMLAAEAAGNRWAEVAPVVTPVLVRSTVRDNLDRMGRAPGVYVTEYSYRDAVYEGRQREFRGFREAVVHSLGDSNAPDAYQRSEFLLGECPREMNGSGYDVCSPQAMWRDNWREALKGLPVISESYDAGGTHMTTEHTRYELRQLYTGRDGRRVVVALPTFKDAFLYDTASYDGMEDPRSGWTDVDVNLTDLAMSGAETRTLSVRATAGTAHVQSQTEYDDLGNTTVAIRYGCIEGCLGGAVDEVLTAESTFALAPGDDSGWLYRETSSFITGDLHAEVRNQISHTYDSRGQLRQSHGALSGTLTLDRFHATSQTIAPAPPQQSAGQGTTAQLLLVDNTYDEFGHIVFKRGPNNSCSGGEVDPDYAHLPVEARAYAGTTLVNGCGDREFTHTVTYDRGLEAVLTSVSSTGAPSQFVYDGFGRLTSSFGPDPDSPGQLAPHPSTQVTYHLPSDATQQPYSMTEVRVLEASSFSAPSVGYRFGYTYIDGLGRELASLTQADMSAGDGAEWVVNGDVVYNTRGLVAQECYPWFWSGDPLAYPLAAPIPTQCKTQEYDAFGRPTDSYDACGKHTAHVDHHALSTDAYDGNDLVDGTYMSSLSDGHGRGIRRTERILNGSNFEERHLLNEYSPTGEVERVTQRKTGATDSVRWLKYDSLGRMVLNVEPNTSVGFDPDPSTDPSTIKAWRYAYNDAGDMVGFSDARGCGANYHYDYGGRLLAVDRSPCEAHHPAYSSPNLSTGAGTEGFYRYDDPDPATGNIVDENGIALDIDTSQLYGRVASVWGMGSKAVFAYDGLGRSIGGALQVQLPGTPHTDPAQRYAPRWYVTHQDLDTLDRVETATTGAPVDELRGADGTSELNYTYTARGVVRQVQSSYGLLFDGAVYDAEGKPLEMTMGDPAQTQRQLTYTCRREVDTVVTNRGAAPLWSSPTYQSGTSMSDPTQQISLEHYEYQYDYQPESLGHGVGNITAIFDMRVESEWPAGSKPVDRHFKYDNLYRLIEATYDHGSGGADTWKSPYDRENQDVQNTQTDPSRPLPSPHQSFATRLQEQTYEYDWLGNLSESGDDLDGFWDRSTGTRSHGTASAGPHQVQSASNRSTSASTQGDLDVAYDSAGNVTDLTVRRDGTCLPTGSSCWQRFHYQWDELGQLSRARRWDLTTSPDERTNNDDPTEPVPTRSPDAELSYHYDDGGNRVLKTATDPAANTRHTVYITGGLELRSTVFDSMAGDYVLDPERVSLRLPAGPAVARVLHDPDAPPKPNPDSSNIDQYQHVFLEMADHLGSNTFIIDLHSSELVEFSTYQAYGAIESDYRPPGWDDYREPFKFSGKEEDIEVGLAYFGARYYSPYLGVWISPDPVTIHDLGSDTNPYSYVAGRPIMAVDPDGNSLIALIVGAIVGAVLGMGSSVVTQAAANGWDFSKVEWGIKGVLGAVVMGALGGAVSGGVGSAVANSVQGSGQVAAGMAAGAATSAATYGIGAGIGAYEPTAGGFLAALVGGAAGGATAGALGCGFGEGLASAGVGAGASYLTSSSVTGDWSAKGFALSMGSSLASATASFGLGQVCFVKGTLVTLADGTQRPIEVVELGERLLPDDEACRELDVSRWVQVELDPGALADEDGYLITVLRPRAWADEYSVGAELFFDLEDINFRGFAKVAAIRDGPGDAGGKGCPVTGRFTRLADNVMELHVARNGDEATTDLIELTQNHRLFSVMRGDWVAAGELSDGEVLRTHDGEVRVETVGLGRRPVERVFNLEVGATHQYFVGAGKVLAHNQYAPAGPRTAEAAAEGAAYGNTAGARAGEAHFRSASAKLEMYTTALEMATALEGGASLAKLAKFAWRNPGALKTAVTTGIRDIRAAIQGLKAQLALMRGRLILSSRVRAALKSGDAAVRMEGRVAQRLRGSVTRFQEEVFADGVRIGEIDVETTKSIIEVTSGSGRGKIAQIKKLLGSAVNPEGKEVVLYAPNITAGRAKTIQDLGARVVRSLDDL